MRADFAFGKSGITVELPEGPLYMLAQTRAGEAVPDPEAALAEALRQPLAGPPLRALATGKRSAAIAVCDITRPAPNAVTLPPLLDELHRAGIPAENICLLVATGLHRAASDAEIRTILGSATASRYLVLNHDAHDLARHRELGETARGTPVWIDERFIDADLHITLGLIEPHLMLGFSGGRKLIAPGLAAQETIKVLHSPRFMREPAATEGRTAENPVHGELLEIASMARHDFMLDVTLTRSRRISGVFAGSPVEAHAAGMRFYEQSSLETLPQRADLVITSAAGYPLDLTFYQTIKGITAAQHIAKPGGRILVLSECGEGVGSVPFARRLGAYAGHQQYLDEIRDSPVEVDQWQLEKLALVGIRHELFFYAPGVSPAQLGSLGGQHFADPGAAIVAAMAGLPRTAAVALVPDGPYAFVRAGE